MAVTPEKVLAVLTKLVPALERLTASVPGRLPAMAGGVAAAAVSPLSNPAAMVDKLIAPIGQAFGKITAQLDAALGPIVGMVGKMNPALVQMLEFAMDDLSAIMGQVLQPILQAVIPLVRLLGDTIATMQPAFDPLIEVLSKMIGIIGKTVEPIARLMVPVLGALASILDGIAVPALEFFVQGLEWFSKAVIAMANEVIKAYNEMVADTVAGRALGLRKLRMLNFDEFEKKSARGTAIRETVRFSADDLGAKTREMAFSQTQKNMLDLTKQIANNTGGMIGQLAALLGVSEERVRQIAKSLGYNLE